jgi:hypothetical protein
MQTSIEISDCGHSSSNTNRLLPKIDIDTMSRLGRNGAIGADMHVILQYGFYLGCVLHTHV